MDGMPIIKNLAEDLKTMTAKAKERNLKAAKKIRWFLKIRDIKPSLEHAADRGDCAQYFDINYFEDIKIDPNDNIIDKVNEFLHFMKNETGLEGKIGSNEDKVIVIINWDKE